MVVWNKQLFEEIYSCNGWPYGVRNYPKVPIFHYNWFGQQRSIKAIAGHFLSLPGATQATNLAIVGGGYGWSAELLEPHGINALSIDTSPHILGTKDTSEETELREYLIADGFDPDNLPEMMSPEDPNLVCNPWDYWLRTDGKRTSKLVVDEDMSTAASRNAVTTALGSVDRIISEYSLETVETEADALVFLERCELLRPNANCKVYHFVTEPPHDSRFVSKTSQEWKTLISTNGFDHDVVTMRGVIV
jgi:hypothetical protein